MKKILSVLNDRNSFDVPPVWFMRQAGRYLPEYHEIRAKKNSFLDLVYSPDEACEVSMQPVRRFPIDAVILFSDILVIPDAMGQKVEFSDERGPILGKFDIDDLGDEIKSHRIENVYQTVRNISDTLKKEKKDDVALIGFAGSPWTVACYMIEGVAAGDCIKTREFAYSNPEKFSKLIKKIENITIDYVSNQIENGAEVIQLFDSKAGFATGDLFDEYVVNSTQNIIKNLKLAYPKVPIIGFPLGVVRKRYSDYCAVVEIDCISVDYFTKLETIPSFAQRKLPVQGNLDPALLLSGGYKMKEQIRNIIDHFKHTPFIFNLGHGIHKDTKIENVEEALKEIQNLS